MFQNLIWAYPHVNMKYFGHFRYLLASCMIPMSCSGLNQSTTSSTYHLIFIFIKKWQRFTSLYINGCLFLSQCFQKLSSNPSSIQNLVMLFYSIQVQNNSFSYVPTLMLLKLSYTLIVFCLFTPSANTPCLSAIFPQKVEKNHKRKEVKIRCQIFGLDDNSRKAKIIAQGGKQICNKK